MRLYNHTNAHTEQTQPENKMKRIIDTYEARAKLIKIMQSNEITEAELAKLDSICQDLLKLDRVEGSEFDLLND